MIMKIEITLEKGDKNVGFAFYDEKDEPINFMDLPKDEKLMIVDAFGAGYEFWSRFTF